MRSIAIGLVALVLSAPAAYALPFLCLPAPLGALPWRDCNMDGFEGFGPANVNPYRAELLFDTSVCPPVAGPPGSPGDYNDGRCVRERG